MLSVIICTYNRDKHIYNVLKSLADNTLPRNRYEIVLVDNNCTDNTRSECGRFVKDFPGGSVANSQRGANCLFSDGMSQRGYCREKSKSNFIHSPYFPEHCSRSTAAMPFF